MPTEETKQQTREVLRHPVKWVKGTNLPEDKVRPWEMAVQIFPNVFSGLRNGFTYNTMTMFQNVFGIEKRPQAVGTVVSTIWDGINDPLVGAFMDSKNYPIRTHRWIARIGTLFTNMLVLLPMFDFGLTVWQRIGFFIAVSMVKDFFWTGATVSNAKIFAYTTPHSSERAKLSWAYGIGQTIHEMLVPLYSMFIGLREVLGVPEHHIYLYGVLFLTLPTMFAEMAPSFKLQRVPDKPMAEKETKGFKDFFKELKECFTLIKYNKWFLLDVGARLLTTLTPGVSENDFYRFCGVDEVMNTGKIKGEFLLFLRDNIVSLPGVVLQPFALPIIKKLGGPRNAQVLYRGVTAAAYTLRLAVGMKTQGGILFSWLMEMFSRVTHKIELIAVEITKYEMLDYMEWKTGRRAEGVTMAMDGLMNKLVANNVDTVVGSLVIDGLGFNPKAQTAADQPDAYRKWAYLLYLIVPIIDHTIFLIARLLYKYPDELREQVEADLIERRRLEQELETAVIAE